MYMLPTQIQIPDEGQSSNDRQSAAKMTPVGNEQVWKLCTSLKILPPVPLWR